MSAAPREYHVYEDGHMRPCHPDQMGADGVSQVADVADDDLCWLCRRARAMRRSLEHFID